MKKAKIRSGDIFTFVDENRVYLAYGPTVEVLNDVSYGPYTSISVVCLDPDGDTLAAVDVAHAKIKAIPKKKQVLLKIKYSEL